MESLVNNGKELFNKEVFQHIWEIENSCCSTWQFLAMGYFMGKGFSYEDATKLVKEIVPELARPHYAPLEVNKY